MTVRPNCAKMGVSYGRKVMPPKIATTGEYSDGNSSIICRRGTAPHNNPQQTGGRKYRLWDPQRRAPRNRNPRLWVRWSKQRGCLHQ